VTGLLADSVWLALVLGHSGVNLLDDIRSDRAGEDGGHGVGVARGLAAGTNDGDGRSRGHLCCGLVSDFLELFSI
jgi:hypothetical protein